MTKLDHVNAELEAPISVSEIGKAIDELIAGKSPGLVAWVCVLQNVQKRNLHDFTSVVGRCIQSKPDAHLVLQDAHCFVPKT